MPRQFFDDIFHLGPEPDQLQGVVTPSGRDAKIGLVRGNVMDPVMLTRQNYVALLQPLDGSR